MNHRHCASWVFAIPLLSVIFAPALAQEKVWRCGQTLTNQWPQDSQLRQTCTAIEPGGVIFLAPAATPTAAAASATAPRERIERVQVNPDEQKQRDAQARQLLQTELERVQSQLRLARLQGDTQRAAHAQTDIESLQRELSRLP